VESINQSGFKGAPFREGWSRGVVVVAVEQSWDIKALFIML